MQSLILYNAPQSTCSQRVRFTLHEKGLAFSEHKLDLFSGDQLRLEYLKINPNGVVPSLVHDGGVVIDSAVIIEYLNEVFPEPTPLVPQDPVTLGLCSQIDLDAEVKKSAKRVVQQPEAAGTLLPAAATTGPQPDEAALREGFERAEAAAAAAEAEEEARMLANLRGMGGGDSKPADDLDHD